MSIARVSYYSYYFATLVTGRSWRRAHD